MSKQDGRPSWYNSPSSGGGLSGIEWALANGLVSGGAFAPTGSYTPPEELVSKPDPVLEAFFDPTGITSNVTLPDGTVLTPEQITAIFLDPGSELVYDDDQNIIGVEGDFAQSVVEETQQQAEAVASVANEQLKTQPITAASGTFGGEKISTIIDGTAYGATGNKLGGIPAASPLGILSGAAGNVGTNVSDSSAAPENIAITLSQDTVLEPEVVQEIVSSPDVDFSLDDLGNVTGVVNSDDLDVTEEFLGEPEQGVVEGTLGEVAGGVGAGDPVDPVVAPVVDPVDPVVGEGTLGGIVGGGATEPAIGEIIGGASPENPIFDEQTAEQIAAAEKAAEAVRLMDAGYGRYDAAMRKLGIVGRQGEEYAPVILDQLRMAEMEAAQPQFAAFGFGQNPMLGGMPQVGVQGIQGNIGGQSALSALSNAGLNQLQVSQQPYNRIALPQTGAGGLPISQINNPTIFKASTSV
jgi:hypothetical protein